MTRFPAVPTSNLLVVGKMRSSSLGAVTARVFDAASVVWSISAKKGLWSSACGFKKIGTVARSHSPPKSQNPGRRAARIGRWLLFESCVHEPANLQNPTAVTRNVAWPSGK